MIPELLKKALDTTKPDSRKRRGMAIAYSALLNYFEIQHDLNKYNDLWCELNHSLISGLNRRELLNKIGKNSQIIKELLQFLEKKRVCNFEIKKEAAHLLRV